MKVYEVIDISTNTSISPIELLNNEGKLVITGKNPKGKPEYISNIVWEEHFSLAEDGKLYIFGCSPVGGLDSAERFEVPADKYKVKFCKTEKKEVKNMESGDKRRFIYRGPVTKFGRVVANDFSAVTFATTEAKALSNLRYQYNKAHGFMATAKAELNKKYLKEG